MALKYIPQSWKDDLRTNYNHQHDFYFNPRGRVFPALTSAGISYIKNDETTNMRGTYRMQCGASTDLTYLYTLPQRFIIEGWFKPEFAYDVAASQPIINTVVAGDAFLLFYQASTDKILFYTTVGGTSTSILTTAFTANAELQKWIYVRCFFDNTAKLKGFYCTVNGVVYSDSQDVPGAGTFVPRNTMSFMPTVAAESSYWIIHELDEALATGEYKTYQADRQIVFDFNGTTLGRERIRIPLVHDSDDQRGVKSFNLSKSVENPMTGSAGANTAGLTLLNVNGSFSDDQYDAFDPFQGRYNGTEKYLQNRVPFEIESKYSRDGDVRDVPNGTPLYLIGAATTDDWSAWTLTRCTKTVSSGHVTITATDINPRLAMPAGVTGQHGKKLRIKISTGSIADITASVVQLALTPFTTQVDFLTQLQASPSGVVINATISDATAVDKLMISLNGPAGISYTVDWFYIGDLSELTDPMPEPLFIGRTTPGAFKRNSPSKFYGDVKVTLEDGISELGETKLRSAHGYDSFDLSDPASEATSLIHTIPRLVTQKEIRNYALNSSFENATITNSWANSGMLTWARSTGLQVFGTYTGRCEADAIGDEITQDIDFTGNDKLDVGDVFNFSAYIYQTVASSMLLAIREYNGASYLSIVSSQVSSAQTATMLRVNVSHTIQSASCNRLRIKFNAAAVGIFHIDGVMLTRGIDPIDYFLVNANDGASGVGSADDAETTTYDTVAIDADAVDVAHPYALVEKGSTAWDAIKKIGDASIASYIGMTPDGVLSFKVRYNGDDRPNLGDIEDFGGVATSLNVQGANAIKVHGVILKKEAELKQLWSGASSGLFFMDGSNMKHPVDDGDYIEVQGSSTLELKYLEDL